MDEIIETFYPFIFITKCISKKFLINPKEYNLIIIIIVSFLSSILKEKKALSKKAISYIEYTVNSLPYNSVQLPDCVVIYTWDGHTCMPEAYKMCFCVCPWSVLTIHLSVMLTVWGGISLFNGKTNFKL